MTPSVKATGDFDDYLYISLAASYCGGSCYGSGWCNKASGGGGITGYSQNCLQKNEKILSISTSPGRNFAVNCSCEQSSSPPERNIKWPKTGGS